MIFCCCETRKAGHALSSITEERPLAAPGVTKRQPGTWSNCFVCKHGCICTHVERCMGQAIHVHSRARRGPSSTPATIPMRGNLAVLCRIRCTPFTSWLPEGGVQKERIQTCTQTMLGTKFDPPETHCRQVPEQTEISPRKTLLEVVRRSRPAIAHRAEVGHNSIPLRQTQQYA